MTDVPADGETTALNQPLRIPTAVKGPVLSVAFGSGAGGAPLLASAGGDGTVRLWDPATGGAVGGPLAGHTGPVWSVAFGSGAGGAPLLASAGEDGTVRLWDPVSGAGSGVAAVVAHRGPATSLAASDAAAARLFSGGADGSVVAWPVDYLRALHARGGLDEVFAGENTGTADYLSRGLLAEHVAQRLRQLTSSDRSQSPEAGDLTGSGIIHLDGRWGAGKTTLIESLLRSQSSVLRDPVVVRYDAWRQASIAPEWWSIASEVRRAVHASRAMPVRWAMTGAEVARRLGRSTSTWIAFVIAVLAGLAGRWLVGESSSVSAQFKAVLDLVTTLSGLLAVGFVLARTLFWSAPVAARLNVRTDDNPLGEISGIVAQLRRWTPQVGVPRRMIDWLAFLWLAITAAMALWWRPAVQVWEQLPVDRRWLILGTVLATISTATAVRLVRSGTRTSAAKGAAAEVDRSGSRSHGTGRRSTRGLTVQRVWRRVARAARRFPVPAVLVAVAVLASLPLLGQIAASWGLLDRTTRAWAGLFLTGVVVYAVALVVLAGRKRRMVLLVIDDIDRCGADRVVRLLEAVHTVLRERDAPRVWRRWRKPAPLGVIVLASGQWVRDAFTSQYATFDKRTDEGTVHDLGADFLQKVFDHSVLVPALSPEQTEGLIHHVAGSPPSLIPDRPERSMRTSAAIPEAARGARDERDSDQFSAAATAPSGAALDSLGTNPPAGAAMVRAGQSQAQPEERRAPSEASAPPPAAHADKAPTPVDGSAKEDLGVNAQLLVTHLLTDFPDILPGNPRLIIRVASAWAMLRAVAGSLGLPRDSEPAKEILVRAAVIWVRFPVLVDEILDADSPPVIDPTSPDCLPRWRRRDVQQVLTMRNGQRIDIEDLSHYYGTFFAPRVAAQVGMPAGPQRILLVDTSQDSAGES